jgi:tetratricopeptide (TPR) repeat protein
MERRTLYTLAGLGGAVALAAALFGHAPQAAASSARVPVDPGEVLESLPYPASDARSRQISALRRALTSKPDDLVTALQLAHLDIQLARERSDPRYLGHAQAALAPWWGEQLPPVDVLVLRATIEQSLHDFDAALRDLDRAVEGAPEHAQAWLTRAVVLTVRGRYDEARLSCAHLVPLASNLVVAVCQTSIDSLTGQAGPAYERLGEALRRAGRVSPDEEAWARSSLGEYALRAGKLDEADRSFRRALELDPEDGYVRAAFADLMLDRGRPAEALALVRGREANDALLLRIALAEQRLHAPEARSHLDALTGRFDASRLRGDVVHRREEARFWLELKGDPARALDLAKANWEVQKEPWDARIVLEAARGAKAPAEAAPVLAWLAETKLEDPFLAKVAAELGQGPPR